MSGFSYVVAFVAVVAAATVSAEQESEVVPPLRDYIMPNTFQYKALESFVETTNCKLAVGVSPLMSSKLVAEMEDFCVLSLKQWPDVVITIEKGYKTATTAEMQAKDTSLYFGGRALELSADGQSTASIFSQLRTWEIFDFSSHDATAARIYVSVLPDLCFNERPVDLAFLLDGSGSISAADWVDSKNFVETVSDLFTISPTESRVAISVFSSDRADSSSPDQDRCLDPMQEHWTDYNFQSWTSSSNPGCICVLNNSKCTGVMNKDGGMDECNAISLNINGNGGATRGVLVTHMFPAAWGALPNGSSRCQGGEEIYEIFGGGTLGHAQTVLPFSTDAATVKTTILDLPQPHGFTRTSLGLQEIKNTVMQEINGMRGSEVPKVLIVLTDGASSPGFEPKVDANALHVMGVTVIAVGVGGFDINELQDVASAPENVLTVNDFSQLKDITKKVDTLTCGACLSTAWATPLKVSLVGGDFVCIQPTCGEVPASSLVKIVTTTGNAKAYISQDQFGGPLDNVHADTSSSDVKALTIAGTDGQPYVILEGAEANTQVEVTFSTPLVRANPISVSTAPASLVHSLEAQFPKRAWTITAQTTPGFFTMDGASIVVGTLTGGSSTQTVTLTSIGTDGRDICGSVVNVEVIVVSAAPTTAAPSAAPIASPTTNTPTVVGSPTMAKTTKSPVQPTPPPTMKPTAVEVPCDSTATPCKNGKGVCMFDNPTSSLFCKCAAGLVQPDCRPEMPVFEQPGTFQASFASPVDTNVGVVKATVPVGVIGFAMDDNAVFTGELTTSRNRRVVEETTLATPFKIDATTGEVFVKTSPMPGVGTYVLDVSATATSDGASGDAATVSLTIVVTKATPPVITLSPTITAAIIENPDTDTSSSADPKNTVSGGGIAAIIIVFLLVLFICMFFLFRRWQSEKDKKRPEGINNPAYGEARKIDGEGRDGMFQNALYAATTPSDGVYEQTVFKDPLYQVPLNPRGGAAANATYGVAPNARNGLVNNALYADLEGANANNEDLYMDPRPTQDNDNIYSDGIAVYDSVKTVSSATPNANMRKKVNEADNQLYDVAGVNANDGRQTQSNQAIYDSATVGGNDAYMETDAPMETGSPIYDVGGGNDQYLVPDRPDHEQRQVTHTDPVYDVGGNDQYMLAEGHAPQPVYDIGNNDQYLMTEDDPAATDNTNESEYLDVQDDDAAATTGKDYTPEVRNVLRNSLYKTEEELSPLPEGWVTAVDDTGNTYYYNSETQSSTWERPKPTAPVAARRPVATSRPGNKYWVESVYIKEGEEDDV
eukprot:m.22103 g.22103  ORF g.22103 m.22103 type:complete len:1287 (-) comp13692_c0_seq1:564-4424(-)